MDVAYVSLCHECSFKIKKTPKPYNRAGICQEDTKLRQEQRKQNTKLGYRHPSQRGGRECPDLGSCFTILLKHHHIHHQHQSELSISLSESRRGRKARANGSSAPVAFNFHFSIKHITKEYSRWQYPWPKGSLTQRIATMLALSSIHRAVDDWVFP